MPPARGFGTAARRWEGVGPYYAMFPTHFSDDVVSRMACEGDVVVDPFSGRGTALFSAATLGRSALGVEINPVGWCYAKSKLYPAPLGPVSARISGIAKAAPARNREALELPEFFHHCFSVKVREFLLEARSRLDWRADPIDRTTMALLLVCLHGKKGSAFSNQMRQTKAMAPGYAVKWWKERGMDPPDLDPVEFMSKRLAWRYAKGTPQNFGDSDVLLGDAESQIAEIRRRLLRQRKEISLVLTSPPYFGLTNYHYDQWLRLWLLGGEPSAHRVPGTSELQGKFENSKRYAELLKNVFSEISPALSATGIVYVRTGRGAVTLTATRQALLEAFPLHSMTETDRPYSRPTQTSLFGDSRPKAGEVDLVMTPTT